FGPLNIPPSGLRVFVSLCFAHQDVLKHQGKSMALRWQAKNLPFLISVCLCASVVSPTYAQGRLTPENLRCEYRVNPVGIDETAPRRSWTLTERERGQVQSAYQVLVASSEARLQEGRADLWDSGRLLADRTMQAVYQGKPLAAGQRCAWKVRSWD